MEHRTRRTLRHVVTTVAMLISVAWSASASAATEECFLRVDGVPGDDARPRGEIELLSWTLGMTSPVAATPTGTAAAVGRADFQPLRVTQRIDRAVPALVQAGASGRHVPTAVLTCRRPGREVSAVRLDDSADAPPGAEITLAYGRISIEYRPQMPDGSLGPAAVGGWDVRANKPQ